MAASIGSNISALVAQRLLSSNDLAQRQSLTRLSSGLRINSAVDDAAGLAVASSLSAKSRVYTQGIRNANDGISLLSIADGTLQQPSDVVTRLKELATSSANGSLGRLQRVSNDKEAEALVDEFNRLAASTSFNGRKILDGQLGELALQLGFGSSERIGVRIGDELSRSRLVDYSSAATGSVSHVPGSTISSFADLNGDGHLDVIAGDDAASLYVSLGNGDGTFQAATAVGSGTVGVTASIGIADFNGDGKLDLLEGSSDGFGGGGLYLSLGNGDGSFQAASLIGAGGSISQVKVGDMNNDGRMDVVYSSNIGAISTRLGTGTGAFGSAVSTGFTTNGALSGMELGDLNGDGKLDIAYGTASGIRSALGTGSGTFQSSIVVSSVGSSIGLSLADFNSDGILDISAYSGSSVYSYTGAGNGTFGSATLVGAGSHTSFAADINGDGEMDIVTGRSGGKTMAYFGNGRGTFTSAALSADTAYGAADLNGDGVLDLSTNDRFWVANTEDSTSIQRVDLTTRESALSAIDQLDSILRRLSSERGVLGGLQSRLNAGVGALLARVENYDTARSRITDVDVAQESAELVKRQILSQVGASVLAQANQAPALALQLLR